MKKNTLLCITLVLSLVIFTGCGSSPAEDTVIYSDDTVASDEDTVVYVKNELDLIVGRYVGMYSMSSGAIKGATFDIYQDKRRILCCNRGHLYTGNVPGYAA